MRTITTTIGLLLASVGCYSYEHSTGVTESITADRVVRSRSVEVRHDSSSNQYFDTRTPDQKRRSETLRNEIGAPEGWLVAVKRQRDYLENGSRHTRAILELKTDSKSHPYRLAIAESHDEGSLTVRIDHVCSEGFTTYSERMFADAPTDDAVDEFAVDYKY